MTNSKSPALLASHDWGVTPAQAREIQRELAGRVMKEKDLDTLRYVAGVDVGFEDNGKTTRAVVAVLSYPELELLEYGLARRPTSFPYVPGLLSFREVPAILDALGKLTLRPDVLLCDGQGIAHPRRFGVASHLGVLTGLPSIGVAKTRLTGSHDEVPDEKGGWVSLIDGEEEVGAVLRTRKGVKPVYISIGHRVDLPTAIDIVMSCTPRYRLPETTRWADGIASRRPSFMKRLKDTGLD
jgi:deoxyribonuclease V